MRVSCRGHLLSEIKTVWERNQFASAGSDIASCHELIMALK
jgi:hypothetical protein